MWIAAGVAGLLCISGVLWWFGKGAAPMSGESAPVLARPRVSTDKSGTGSAEPAPIFDDRDAPRIERAGVDASTFYKDAFALYDALSAEQKGIVSRPGEELNPDTLGALLEKIQPIMELLQRGAAADYCDWGLGETTFESPFPQLGKSQNLAKVALWNAAHRFPTEAEGAIDDLSARARLGHHLADTLIGLLVDSSFEKSATNLLRQNAPAFNDATRAKAAAFLAASTIDRDVETGLEGERNFGRSFYKKIEAQTPDERVNSIQMMGLGGDDEANPGAGTRKERAEALVRDTRSEEHTSELQSQ